MSPNAQLRANFTPRTGDLWHHIYVVPVACMTDSHAYSYLHMARQNEACLLPADCVDSLLSVLYRLRSNPKDLIICVCEARMVKSPFWLYLRVCVCG